MQKCQVVTKTDYTEGICSTIQNEYTWKVMTTATMHTSYAHLAIAVSGQQHRLNQVDDTVGGSKISFDHLSLRAFALDVDISIMFIYQQRCFCVEDITERTLKELLVRKVEIGTRDGCAGRQLCVFSLIDGSIM